MTICFSFVCQRRHCPASASRSKWKAIIVIVGIGCIPCLHHFHIFIVGIGCFQLKFSNFMSSIDGYFLSSWDLSDWDAFISFNDLRHLTPALPSQYTINGLSILLLHRFNLRFNIIEIPRMRRIAEVWFYDKIWKYGNSFCSLRHRVFLAPHNALANQIENGFESDDGPQSWIKRKLA